MPYKHLLATNWYVLTVLFYTHTHTTPPSAPKQYSWSPRLFGTIGHHSRNESEPGPHLKAVGGDILHICPTHTKLHHCDLSAESSTMMDGKKEILRQGTGTVLVLVLIILLAKALVLALVIVLARVLVLVTFQYIAHLSNPYKLVITEP